MCKHASVSSFYFLDKGSIGDKSGSAQGLLMRFLSTHTFSSAVRLNTRPHCHQSVGFAGHRLEAELHSGLDASPRHDVPLHRKTVTDQFLLRSKLNASHRVCDHRWLHKPSTRQARNKRIHRVISCMDIMDIEARVRVLSRP